MNHGCWFYYNQIPQGLPQINNAGALQMTGEEPEMGEKKVKYDYNRLRRDLQDEYLAAMVVGFDENTPDLMDIQMAPNEALLEAAPRFGYHIEDYVIDDEDEGDEKEEQGEKK